MNNNISNIHLGIGLADSELLGYSYSSNNNILIIEIKAWNENIIEITFISPILFIDKGCEAITAFRQNFLYSDIYLEALNKTYEKIPEDHPYKYFQFLNLDDEPVLEIISENYHFQILKKSNKNHKIVEIEPKQPNSNNGTEI